MTKTEQEPRTLFRTRVLPVPAFLAGYAYLIDRFALNTILPYRLHVVATVSTQQSATDCIVHSVAKRPAETVYDHLVFALKYEGVNLLILKQIFSKIEEKILDEAIAAKPTSSYARRLCFLFEWLTDRQLIVPEGLGGAYADAIDTRWQYGADKPVNVRRWRVRDNMPGESSFCPLVMRTSKIDRFNKSNLSARAAEAIQDVPPDVLRRAAAFLLLNDSKASFEIEKERPSKDRAQRWAAVIGRAGETPLTIASLVDMQRDLIEDNRFVRLGLRTEGGFVGEHTAFGEPRPDHISAPAKDLDDLMDGLVSYDQVSTEKDYDPVFAAASLAFGFVYIHPFEDGNGRLHRYLIHHALAGRGFLPDGVVAPISSAILADLVGYRHVLEVISRPMLTVIDWRQTERGNVEVLNEISDLYRYFDATLHVEFLYDCLERTIGKLLPDELRFLSARDNFHREAAMIVDMPERMLDNLFHMLRNNGGRFSNRMRSKEFAALQEEEFTAFESAFQRATE